jgi:hypothetical protein
LGKGNWPSPQPRRQAGILPCFIHNARPGEGQIGPGIFLEELDVPLQLRGRPQVIRIQKRDIRAPGFFNSPAHWMRHAAMRLGEYSQARVFLKAAQRLNRSIRRAIVHDDQLKVGEGLREDRLNGQADVIGNIVRGHDDADRGALLHIKYDTTLNIRGVHGVAGLE